VEVHKGRGVVGKRGRRWTRGKGVICRNFVDVFCGWPLTYFPLRTAHYAKVVKIRV